LFVVHIRRGGFQPPAGASQRAYKDGRYAPTSMVMERPCGNMGSCFGAKGSARQTMPLMLARFQKHHRWIIIVMVVIFVGSMLISSVMMFR
jgi:hypothetical protein